MLNRIIKTVLILTLFCKASAGLLYAEMAETTEENNSCSSSDKKIKEIKITGLRKTKKSYIDKLLKKYTEKNVSEIDISEIELALYKENLFSELEVSMEYDENGEPFISITVEEKIYFIPAPFFSFSDGNILGGLVILDTNAFGVKDFFVAQGAFSSDLKIGLINFMKPSLSIREPGFSVFGKVSDRNTEIENTDGDTQIEYKYYDLETSVFLLEKFSDWLSGNIGVGFLYINPRHNDSLKSLQYFSLQTGLNLSFSDKNQWFLSTSGIDVSGKFSVTNEQEFMQSLKTSLTMQKPFLTERLRLTSIVSGYFSNNTNIYDWQPGTTVGISILPDHFESENLFGTNLGFEIGMVRTNNAIFSVYSRYEFCYVQDTDEDFVFNHGFSAGLRMYLSKVAVPAIGIQISENLSTNTLKYAVAFGISM